MPEQTNMKRKTCGFLLVFGGGGFFWSGFFWRGIVKSIPSTTKYKPLLSQALLPEHFVLEVIEDLED